MAVPASSAVAGRRSRSSSRVPCWYTREVPSYPETDYTAQEPDNSIRAFRDDVMAQIRAGDPTLVDVRSPQEYSGELLHAVEGVHRQGGTEGGGRHRHLDRRVEVVAAALEDRVAVDRDLDVEVAGGPGAVPDLPLPRELDPGAGVDARGHLERQGAAGAHPAVAGALVARVGDDLAEALAGQLLLVAIA